MVQYLKKKKARRTRRSFAVSFVFFALGALSGLAGYFMPDYFLSIYFPPENRYILFPYLVAGGFLLLFVLSILLLLVRLPVSPDKRFQLDLGEIHGNAPLEKAFDDEMNLPYAIHYDHALLTDRWLVYERRRGRRRAVPIAHILWVYRYDQGVADQKHVSHDLAVVTASKELHAIHFKTAAALTLFITGIHRLAPWIFFGYSKATSRGYTQNFDVFLEEVAEAHRLYLLDHPHFLSSLRGRN